MLKIIKCLTYEEKKQTEKEFDKILNQQIYFTKFNSFNSISEEQQKIITYLIEKNIIQTAFKLGQKPDYYKENDEDKFYTYSVNYYKFKEYPNILFKSVAEFYTYADDEYLHNIFVLFDDENIKLILGFTIKGFPIISGWKISSNNNVQNFWRKYKFSIINQFNKEEFYVFK